MKTPPIEAWYLIIDDPDNFMPSWHPREAIYLDWPSAEAHAALARRLGGAVRVFCAGPVWTEVDA